MADFVKDKAGAEDFKFKDSGTERSTYTRENETERNITLNELDGDDLNFRSVDSPIGGILDGSIPIAPQKISFTSAQPIVTGAGSPEGVVAADKGSLYLNTTGGVSSAVYYKTTDTVNTGWVPVSADADTVDGFDTGDGPNEIPVLTAGAILDLANGTGAVSGSSEIYMGLIGGSPTATIGAQVVGAGGSIIEESRLALEAGKFYMVCGTYTGVKAAGADGNNILSIDSDFAAGLLNLPTVESSIYEYRNTNAGATVFGIGQATSTGFAQISLRLKSLGANTTTSTASLIAVGPISV